MKTLQPRTRIKMCGLTRECDVDAAVAAGADAVGFVLYARSPRYVTPDRAAVLARRLPPFVTPVLLFVNPDPEEVLRVRDTITGAIVQFHGDETASQCVQANRGYAYLRAVRIRADDPAPAGILHTMVSEHERALAFVLDTYAPEYGGTGHRFDWTALPPLPQTHVVLAGGLTPANVGEAIAMLRPRCLSLTVDVSSGIEVTGHKGLKDPDKIAQFAAAVRAADTCFSSAQRESCPESMSVDAYLALTTAPLSLG
ncbi:phosphoribosylanthranilate isomerase [Candidatus Symbiobacter mobilis]|uniref:N-(5'-phosphoribosyl)anthranilate isomerase n=1 Tax=Candidatus Symbiobacter mobilis CR TaxID=946483 RepID=U5NB26_9BURK|nr:phosphoribosylanthranilate isomerase [Candidatus Symbiobacter mobilis]AGX88515.1 phosphoribosylanthranilate isomerase [Candidatus Symbiobacter mobilis CR]